MADTRLITVRVKKEDGGQVNVSFPSTGTLAELKKAVRGREEGVVVAVWPV